MAENVFKILVEEGAAALPTERRRPPTERPKETTSERSRAKEAERQTRGIGSIFAIGKKFLPFLIGIGSIVALVKASKVISGFTYGMRNILGAMFDVFFAPLAPLFAAFLQAISPLIPIISMVATTILTPFVKLITPIIQWMADKMATVAGWLSQQPGWVKAVAGSAILAGLALIPVMLLKAVMKLSAFLLGGLAKMLPGVLGKPLAGLAGAMGKAGAFKIPGMGMVGKAISPLGGFARKGADFFSTMVYDIAGYIDSAAATCGRFFSTTLPSMVGTAGSAISGFISSSIAKLSGFATGAVAHLSKVAGAFKAVGAAAISSSASILKSIPGAMAGMAKSVAGAVASAGKAVAAFMARAFAALVGFFAFLGPGAPIAAGAVIAGAIAGMVALGRKAANVVGGFQKGGRLSKTGLALVGERGPELVRLPRGAEVIEAKRTRQILQTIKGYQAGTPYVPRDMLALLHRGEAVVPRGHTVPAIATTVKNYNISAPISLEARTELDVWEMGRNLKRRFAGDIKKEIMKKL